MKRVLFFVLLLVFSCSVLVFAEENITRFTYQSALETAVKIPFSHTDDTNIRPKKVLWKKQRKKL